MRTFLRILSVILLVSWMAVIFMFSSQNADVSSDTSGRIVKLVVEELYPDFENLSEAEQQKAFENCQYIVRKMAHLCAYALLGFFAFLTFVSYTKMRFFTRMFLGAAVCVLYAVSDEYHQRFVPGRSGELRDLLIDTAGVLVAIVFMTAFVKIIPSLRRKTDYNPVKKVKETASQNEKSEEVAKAEEIPQLEEVAPVEETNFVEEIAPEIQEEALPTETVDLNEDIQMDFDAVAEDFLRDLDEIADKLGLENIELLEELLDEISEESDAQIVEEESSLEQIEEPAQEKILEVIEKVTKKPKIDVKLSEEMEYAASVIGKAVVEVTKICNTLSSDEQDLTRKELINLALGRTEVLKSKILEILGLQIGFEQKKIFIEDERKDTYDYFNSIIAQIS